MPSVAEEERSFFRVKPPFGDDLWKSSGDRGKKHEERQRPAGRAEVAAGSKFRGQIESLGSERVACSRLVMVNGD